MLNKLASIAHKLDLMGEHEAADEITAIMKKVASKENNEEKPNTTRIAGHIQLLRCAQILDVMGDYEDADQITGLLKKYAADIKDKAIDSVESDFGDESFSPAAEEEITDVAPTRKPLFYPEDIIPHELDLNPSNRDVLNFYEQQGENGPAPWLLGEKGTMTNSRANDKPGERWLGTDRHVTINRSPSHLDKPHALRQLWMPNDAYEDAQAENKNFIDQVMPEDGPKSRSTFHTKNYLKKFKEAPGEADKDERRIVFDRKLLKIVNQLMGQYSDLKGVTPRGSHQSDAEKPIRAFSGDELMKLSLRGLDGKERQERIHEISDRISDKIDDLREDGIIDVDSLDPQTLRALVKAMLYSEAQRHYYPGSMLGLEMGKPEEGYSRNYYPDPRQFNKVPDLTMDSDIKDSDY